MNNKLDCAIVRDLLPLYHDGVVSKETEAAVKGHLEDCVPCSAEYEALRASLPVGKQIQSTKQKFSDMMQKQKTRRIITSVLAAVLTCAILIGAFCILTLVPLVEVTRNVEAIRVYRYETEEESKFFVLYSAPTYGYSRGEVQISGTAGSYTLELITKAPVLSSRFALESGDGQIWTIEAGSYEPIDGQEQWVNYTALELGGKIVWTEETGNSGEVPAYVYAYEESERPNSSIVGWITCAEENYVGAHYEDGKLILWDLDGKVLYEGYPEGNEEPSELLD